VPLGVVARVASQSVNAAFLDDYDAVILDAGGVLLLPDPDALRGCLAPFGVAPDDAACARAHYAGVDVIDGLGVADYREADRTMARLFGVAEDQVDAAAAAIESVYFNEPFVPIPGVDHHLRRLGAAGALLAIVSNASGRVEAELAAHRICAVGQQALADGMAEVAVVVDSHHVGVEKPDPAIFGLALEALGVDAERCLYVGDSVHFDVNGALAAGLHPVHVTVFAGCAGEHLHFPALGDFVDALLGT
jgi:putative hydrolase of the HAD superfamily